MTDDAANSPGTGLAPQFRIPAAAAPWAPPQPVESPTSEWFRSVWRYRWLVLAVTLAGTGGGFGLTRILAPVYRAEATVWVEAGDARYPERGGPVGPGQLLDSYAWIELLKSYVVLDRVIRELGLYVQAKPAVRSGPLADFAVRDGFRPGDYRLEVDDQGQAYALSDQRAGVLERGAVGDSIGRRIAFAWAPAPAALEPGQRIDFSLLTWREAARKLADRLDVRMDPGGNFLRISLSGENPQLVATVLNATIQRYVAVAGQLKREKVTGLGQRLEEQLTSAREQLQGGEEALRRFQQSVGIQPSGSDGPEDPRLSSYLEVSSSLGQTQRDREAIESTLRERADTSTGWASLAFIPAVQQSPGLKGALDELDRKLAELRGLRYRYTDQHPDVQQLAGQVEVLTARTIPDLARQLADELRAREAQLNRSLAAASREVRAIPSQTIEQARLKRQVTIADNLYTTLQQRYDEARLAEASSVPDVRILDAAVAPTAPVENTTPRLMLMAFVGSLGASILGATLLARLDRRVRSPEQVGLELGLPLLGLIPHIYSRGKGLTDEQAAELEEALRGVRLSVLNAYGAPPPIAITVTSPGPGDGKSFVSSRLALTLADAGYRTVLVDGDVRRGRLHHILERPRRPGLIDHLQGQASVPDIIQTTGVELLEFIACGTRHHGGPELLGSSPMRDLLSTLRARYQAIIVDSAPMAGAIDPFVLGAATGSLLLVLRTGYTDRRVTAAKLGVLDRLPIRPLGVVLNDVREAGAYRLYSYYLPGYTSDDEDGGARRSLPGIMTL